jgi:Phage integrase, N-terminal SAM-like domain
MARRATGAVLPPKGRQKSWAIRFSDHGKRRWETLGRPEDGWDRERAEARLRHVLADVERGIYRPPEPEPAHTEPEPEQTFREFASEWYARHEGEWRPNTGNDYLWALSYHLLAFFGEHRLSEITIEEVDRYKTAKQREGVLSNNSINKTLTRLSQGLEDVKDRRGDPRGRSVRRLGRGAGRIQGPLAPHRPWRSGVR